MSENNQQDTQQIAPTQGQMYIPPQYYQAPEEEIDLRELFGVLWKGKWWIIGITVIFAIASVFYALSLQNEYKASVIVAPASESGGGLSAMAGQLGGLASLAGVKLGASEINDVVIAMEIMKSWGFIDGFIKKYELQVPIFAAQGWNQSNNKLSINEELYDSSQKKWIRNAPKGKTVEPTSWELYQKFKERLTVVQDSDTGLIRIDFVHFSPEFAQDTTGKLVNEVNLILKKQAQDDATRNIDYLEGQVQRTPISEMQSVFYSLIEEQMKIKMLASVSDEYIFKYISKANIPEEKFRPKRVIICIGITLFGGFLSLIILILNWVLRGKGGKA